MPMVYVTVTVISSRKRMMDAPHLPRSLFVRSRRTPHLPRSLFVRSRRTCPTSSQIALREIASSPQLKKRFHLAADVLEVSLNDPVAAVAMASHEVGVSTRTPQWRVTRYHFFGDSVLQLFFSFLS